MDARRTAARGDGINTTLTHYQKVRCPLCNRVFTVTAPRLAAETATKIPDRGSQTPNATASKENVVVSPPPGRTRTGSRRIVAAAVLTLAVAMISIGIYLAIRLFAVPAVERPIAKVALEAPEPNDVDGAAQDERKPKIDPPAVAKDDLLDMPVMPESADDETLRKLAIRPLKMDAKKVTVELPDVFDEVIPAGGGRFLVFHMKKLHKAALFDVNEGKIVHSFPLDEEQVLIAAGIDKLILAYPASKRLERWSLLTREKEQTCKSEDIRQAIQIGLGSASRGPLYARTEENRIELYDTKTLNKLKLRKVTEAEQAIFRLRVSSDGSTLAGLTVRPGWEPIGNGGGALLWTLNKNTLDLRSIDAGATYAIPDANRELVFTSSGVFSFDGSLVSTLRHGVARGNASIPSSHGPFFLTIVRSQLERKNTQEIILDANIHISGDERAISSIKRLSLGSISDRRPSRDVELDQRFFLVPKADLLVVLPLNDKQVELHSLNVDQMQREAGFDWMTILSKPVREGIPGNRYLYQIEASSRKAELEFRIEHGPDARQSHQKRGPIVRVVG